MPSSARYLLSDTPHRLSRPDRSRSAQEDSVPVILEYGSARHSVVVLEASGYDLRVSSPVAIAPGRPLQITTVSGFPAVQQSFAGFAHYSNAGGRYFEIGLVLERRVPSELELILSGGLRVYLRYQCTVSGTVEWKKTGRQAAATVLNYSRRGICLRLTARAVPGDDFQFRWESSCIRYGRPHTCSQEVDGVIRWATNQEGLYLGGCRLNGQTGYVMSGLDPLLFRSIREE